MKRTVATLACLAALAAGCGDLANGQPAASGSPTPSTVSAGPTVGAPSPLPSAPATFRATITPVPTGLAAEMRGATWHSGCPVPISDLRLLSLSYWGFDGQVHQGPMVVNAAVARAVVWVFRRLFGARFAIKEIALATRYRPNADPNTKLDVTASFNCRPVITPAGPGTTYSMHSYGLAIDIDPLQNPFVAADGYVRNRYTRPYRDRSQKPPGMIHDGDVVVRAFEHVGWVWGGDWSGGKDYMHFSSNGR